VTKKTKVLACPPREKSTLAKQNKKRKTKKKKTEKKNGGRGAR
jgi:hypothetical protein